MTSELISHRISAHGVSVPMRIISSFGADGTRESTVAAIYGEPRNGSLVRIHSKCVYSEIFSSRECDCGWQLRKSRNILKESGGVLIYLDQEGRGAGLRVKAEAYRLTDEDGLDTYEAYEKLGVPPDSRNYAEAAEVLKKLRLRAQVADEQSGKIAGLESSGISVTRVPLIPRPTPTTSAYLEAKKRHGHLL